MNKRVGVSTFCSWTSYGSICQAYAMKQKLKSLGFSSYILNDRGYPSPESKCKVVFSKNIKTTIASIIGSFYKQAIVSQYQKSNAFIKNNVDTIYYNNYAEMALNYYTADYYLAGSDQVFNPNSLRRGLFLDFVEDKSKCITYACSMGTTKVTAKSEPLFSGLINNFSTISVREADNIPILKQYNPDAQYCVNIDPTFLLNADEWRTIEKPYPIAGKYILVYPLYWDKKLNQSLKKLHRQTGLPVVGVFSAGYNRVYCNKKIYDAGVTEFLWLVDHAEAVVTSSFHGLAFSTIFEKKVCVVTNPSMPSRIENLITLLGIEKVDIENLLQSTQDKDKIRGKILEQQQLSDAYLRSVLHVK